MKQSKRNNSRCQKHSSSAHTKKSPEKNEKPNGRKVVTQKACANKSAAKATDGPLQGSKVKLPDVEPWHEPVNGADVLHGVAERHRKYIAMAEHLADACALWEAHAHALDCFLFSARLNISSPEKRCGKSTLRDVIALFVPRPLPTENLTVAVLFRLVEQHRPTVLADEYDAWMRDKEELRGLLNAGHKRGGVVYRCVGDNHDVRCFNVFAPVVMCGIGSLPGTLHDRSIVIRLDRAKPGEQVEGFDPRHTDQEHELCRKLARWCRDNASRIKNCDPVMPPGAVNRLADNWRPLFALAEIAGGEWPRRCAAAFAKLNCQEDVDAQGVGIMLLADIKEVFADTKTTRLESKEICAKLAALEGKPWAEYGRRNEPITVHELAKLLRPLRIQPRDIRLKTGHVHKGYYSEDFQEAFSRYLPPQGA